MERNFRPLRLSPRRQFPLRQFSHLRRKPRVEFLFWFVRAADACGRKFYSASLRKIANTPAPIAAMAVKQLAMN